VLSIAAGEVLRARVWDSAPCKAWLLGNPYLLTVALGVAFAAAQRYPAAWSALGVLMALVAVWVIVALSPRIAEPQTYSLPMRRLVGFLATGLDASVIPVMAYLVGLFSWVGCSIGDPVATANRTRGTGRNGGGDAQRSARGCGHTAAGRPASGGTDG
jgi:ESX secretion system protein EccD